MIAIIKYNAGNTKSVFNALHKLGTRSVVTADPEVIASAEKVIFPGVGQAKSAMQYMRKHHLDRLLPNLEQPVLGICLGMQLMCISTEEGNVECLGIFDSVVRRFNIKEKTPHMGWNNFESAEGILFRGLSPADDMYYVHGYYATSGRHTVATCNYGVTFSAALHKDNFYGVQFHPEKSSSNGFKLLDNFLQI